MDDIFFIGNSHIFFMTGNDVQNDVIFEHASSGVILQHKVYTNVKTMYMGGATAVGFREDHISKTGSFTKAFDEVSKLPNHTKLFFNFGQVDMDVVYPYKCINSKEPVELNTYIDNVLSKYISGILRFKAINPHICVIGINPPSTRTVRVILSNIGQGDLFDSYKSLPYDFLLESRTAQFRIFNEKLKTISIENGLEYIDFWEKLCDDDSSVTKVLRFKYFRPDCDDHHIYIYKDTDWDMYFWNKIRSVCKNMK